VLIPQYSPDLIQAYSEKWMVVPRMLVHARALVTAARLLAEALIERKVTEAELIAAGTDPAADRAMLARFTIAGLDAPCDPLFPDLDALAALIAAPEAML